MKTAQIFNIYRGSTSDGAGIRDTVFFKGCPLNCVWCHNPEGIEFQNEVWWEKGKCVGCGKCIESCTGNCISFGENGIDIDRKQCKHCFVCGEVCRHGAIQRIAEEYTVSQLCDLIMRDKEYFEVSGGGVTASGGEAMCQYEFLVDFFKVMKQNGINVALDTSGYCDSEKFKGIMKYVDTILYDIKVIDENAHIQFTGQSNKLILKNLEIYKKTDGCKPLLWIRTPIIPNMTDTEDNISKIADFIKKNLNGCVKRWELCAFNNSCVGKYQKLLSDWKMADENLLTKTKMERLVDIAKQSEIKEVMYSGLTKKEEMC